jgi:hypothetical protein
MFSTGTPARRWANTSVFANTVQKLLSRAASFAVLANSSSRASGKSSRIAISSRNAPVPAAHLRFIRKSTRLPWASMRITLLS